MHKDSKHRVVKIVQIYIWSWLGLNKNIWPTRQRKNGTIIIICDCKCYVTIGKSMHKQEWHRKFWLEQWHKWVAINVMEKKT